MIRNYILIALRNMRKHPTYTLINTIGLAAGIASVLLIYRIIDFELSFNKSFPNYNNLVRIVKEHHKLDGDLEYNVCVPVPAMDIIASTIPQFAATSRTKEVWPSITMKDPQGGPVKKFNVPDGQTAFFVDPDFFSMFSIQWISKPDVESFKLPGTIVLTESFAKRFNVDPLLMVGKVLLLDNIAEVTVTGIIRDMPVNCDFNFPFLMSWETMLAHKEDFFFDERWGSCASNNQMYAMMQDPGQIDQVDAILASVGKEEYKDRNGKQASFHMLQPMSDLHFDERWHNSGTHVMPMSRLRILGAIGLLILIMACFNFINLSTARATLRASEVGVRKTLGSDRGQLIGQFMGETAILVLVGAAIGAVLAYFLSPLLSYVSEVPTAYPFFSNFQIIGFLVLLVIAVTLLAGFYPSLVLASFSPGMALYGRRKRNSNQGITLRKSLVVLQFVIAQGLVIGALITLLQLDFIHNRDLGFNQDLVYTFPVGVDSTSLSRQAPLKSSLLAMPDVEAVSFSSDLPFSGNTWSSNFRYGDRAEDEPYAVTMIFSDTDYPKTFGLELVAGRWVTPSDTIRQTVINETLVHKLGIQNPEEVVGQTIGMGKRKVEITGVVKDFNTHSLYNEMLPLMLSTRKEYYWSVGVKIKPQDVNATLQGIVQAFDRIYPDQVFEGKFFDESIQEFYENDQKLSRTCKAFGLLAILIASLGLFGLITHNVQERVGEIGVRKVLGASTQSIVGLLSLDFLQLVLIAIVIAGPLAWFLMNRWLQNFAFHIDFQWWVIGVTGLVALLIAFGTISVQAIRAALANPVESLRSE